MKRPPIVYAATALLAFFVARGAWTASRVEADPKYLIGNLTFAGFMAVVTALFYLWPHIIRWIVAPLFVLLALLSVAAASRFGIGLGSIMSLALACAFAWVGLGLFTLKKTPISERSDSPERESGRGLNKSGE